MRGGDWRFVKGDIATFRGTDIHDGQPVEIADGSIDIVIALASLQSSSLADSFDRFISRLVTKLTAEAQLFIGLPNFHFDESRNVALGLFDAKNGRVDHTVSDILSQRLIRILNEHGFHSRKTGERIVFHHFA